MTSTHARSRVHHDTLVIPAGTSADEVRDAAARHARQHMPPDQQVAFVYLHGSRPVPEDDTQVQWRYSYQVHNGAAGDSDPHR